MYLAFMDVYLTNDLSEIFMTISVNAHQNYPRLLSVTSGVSSVQRVYYTLHD